MFYQRGLFYFLLMLTNILSAQNVPKNQVYLTPDVDTLFSNKDYLFKVENESKDSATINVSFDTGYYLNVNTHYVSPNFMPGSEYEKFPIAYVHYKENGFDLQYSTYLKLEGGKAMRANDSVGGGFCNAYITIKRKNANDTIYKKKYYLKCVYDSNRQLTNYDYRFYSPIFSGAEFPKVYVCDLSLLTCPKIYYQHESDVCTAGSKDIKTILSKLNKRNPVTILPKNSGFKVFYASSGYGESKTEADVNNVFYKLRNRLANAHKSLLKSDYFTVKIHLYNPETGEYIKLPMNRINIKK